MSSTFVQTTLDYLTAFKRFSGFDVDYVHVTHHASMGFDFDGYDIVFHNYCARLCFDGYVSESYRERLRNFAGVKVLSVQDEYERTDTLKAAIKDLNFDIVLTCVPQDSLEYVYPRAEFPDVEFITVFTGYVPDDFASALPPPRPLAERPVFIGYRGRDIGGRYGRLGFDKFEIGRRMKELCDARGIKADIAMDEASRIYGKAWLDFVGSCRAMLGSESGSNVFDFDGSIDARFKEMTAANGGVPPGYADFLPIVADRDGEIEMGQISPRIFECAVMCTPMVLFKGRYSDAVVPGEHYIPLEKDFSNLDDVLARLADLPGLEEMAQRAFDHLVGTGRFTYKTFYAGIAAAIERKLARKPWQEAAAQVPVGVLGEDGRILEAPTPWPVGGAALEIRQNLEKARNYHRDGDKLVMEFARVRMLFEAELPDLHDVYTDALRSLEDGSGAGAAFLPDWSLGSSCFAKLLASYDEDDVEFPDERLAAFADFRAAVAGGVEAAGSAAARRLLDVEKSRYLRMVEWLKRLNEAYEGERLQLEHAYHARRDELETRAPARLNSRLSEVVSAVMPLLRRIAAWRRD